MEDGEESGSPPHGTVDSVTTPPSTSDGMEVCLKELSAFDAIVSVSTAL